MKRSILWKLLGVLLAASLIAAACGNDDDGGDTATEEEAPAEDDATEEAPAEDEGTDEEATDEGSDAGTAECEIANSIDEAVDGEGATEALSFLACDAPVAAGDGEPLVIGFQNPEGDPAGSFPEYTEAARAAVEYVNAELGGFGVNFETGAPGVPGELSVCVMAINPADSQRCANELAAEDPFLVVSSLNFFGNHFPIYDAAGVTVIVGTPITVGDFTSPGVFATGGGGGCLGVHTGLVEFVTSDVGATRVAVPWADTPPGVSCYYDLESKPLDVIAGRINSTSERFGDTPDLEHIGVPILPATADVTPQVTEVLEFEPDGIIYSAQGADCWNFVDGLVRLGWSVEEIPLVLSTACIDFDAMEAAGDAAVGIQFVGSSSTQLNDPASIEDVRAAFEAENYQTKAIEYGMSEEDLNKGFGPAGWNAIMNIWYTTGRVATDGGDPTSIDDFNAQLGGTTNEYLYGSTPAACASSPEPYTAVCNAAAVGLEWDGENTVLIKDPFSAIDLLAGTEILPGPYELDNP